MTIEIDTHAIEQAAKTQWQTNPAIRAEFGEIETYIAYQTASARGQVKMAPNRTTTEKN